MNPFAITWRSCTLWIPSPRTAGEIVLRAVLAALLLIACELPSQILAQATSRSVQTFSLDPGPYGVGFEAVHILDSTRFVAIDPVLGTGPREITTLVWYPAQDIESVSTMAYSEYALLDAVKLGIRPITSNWSKVIRNSMLLQYGWGGISPEHLDRELNSRTWAVRDAPHAEGRFPVVLYAPGGGNSAWDNSVLAEYLASHGYVVAAVPSRGWYSSRANYPTGFVGSAAVAADLERVMLKLRQSEFADLTRVAAMGMSRGGITNHLLQARDPSIRAIVGLDGTIAYRYSRDPTPWRDSVETHGSLLASGFGQPERLDVPFLWIGGHTPRSFRDEWGIDPTFLFWDQVRYSRAYRVYLRDLQHQDFSSSWIRFGPSVAETGPVRSPELRSRGYEVISMYVLSFLDAYLKEDSGAEAFLERSAEDNGVEPGFVTIERRRPVGPSPTIATLRRLLEERGFTAADTVLMELLAADPGWTLPWPDLVNWGSTLLAYGRCMDAWGVMRLAAALYPESPQVLSLLGESLLALGDASGAEASYREALEQNPAELFPKQRLDELLAGGVLSRVVECEG